MLGRSSGNHDWLFANASACVSCGFRLRNACNTSDCVWMETGRYAHASKQEFLKKFYGRGFTACIVEHRRLVELWSLIKRAGSFRATHCFANTRPVDCTFTCDIFAFSDEKCQIININEYKYATTFLCASAMLKHVIDIGWTSVRLSHAGTVSKRLNVLSWFLHHTIAHSF